MNSEVHKLKMIAKKANRASRALEAEMRNGEHKFTAVPRTRVKISTRGTRQATWLTKKNTKARIKMRDEWIAEQTAIREASI